MVVLCVGKVGVIGAGVAGLAAAERLGQKHSVVVLEARDRVGGRIFTLPGNCPIELGAEFIHGDRNEVWELGTRCGGFETLEVPDRHWEVGKGRLIENENFWEDLARVMEKFEDVEHDQSFAAFMRKTRGVPRKARALAREYVEGFHSANTLQVGIKSLAESEESAEKTHGQRQFHLRQGYPFLVDCLMAGLRNSGAEVRLNAVVRRVRWHRRSVSIDLEDGTSHQADVLLVTVPLGVLQAQAIEFVPKLAEKQRCIASLRMGNVMKIVTLFTKRFWPIEISGFIHAGGTPFPVWWTNEQGLILTGWAGGPNAEALCGQSQEKIASRAAAQLARIFGLPKRDIVKNIADTFLHNWREDTFSRGAYTYVPKGKTSAPQELARPIRQTLFFAGEAVAPAGEQGTVHGAIASGWHAAEEITKALDR